LSGQLLKCFEMTPLVFWVSLESSKKTAMTAKAVVFFEGVFLSYSIG
jgi:hypothetical protein